MAESTAPAALRPVVSFLKLPADGAPYFEGLRCAACNEVFLDQRSACAKCSARDQLSPVALSNTGTLHTWTVVRRSFPGIAVPYVSAVVDMEPGGAIKGNLINLAPESTSLGQGLAVEAVFSVAPYGDKEGNQYMMYAFQPKDHQLHPEKTPS